MLERRGSARGPARAAGPVVVTATSWCELVPGVGHDCCPPAVAVIGLRRSGRTGNGESPRPKPERD
jgi:hypothetical protein